MTEILFKNSNAIKIMDPFEPLFKKPFLLTELQVIGIVPVTVSEVSYRELMKRCEKPFHGYHESSGVVNSGCARASLMTIGSPL